MSTYDRLRNYNDSDVHGHLPYLQLKTTSHLLITQWSTSTIYGLVTAMIAAVLAGIGYEFISEYSRHLHNRNKRRHGSTCCGTEVFSCCEKFVLSILVMIRVVVGYFMMLCVMTMNIWLLVSIILGAGVGYYISKPVMANIFIDSITAYEYPIVPFKSSDENDDSFVGNVTARSQSWRFKPTDRRAMESTGKRLMESVLSDGETDSHRKSGDFSRYTLRPDSNKNAINVVLIRESRRCAPSVSDIKDEDDIVFLRSKADDTPETRSAFSQTMPSSPSRFRSTSLVINESFRSQKSQSVRDSRVKTGTSMSPKTSGRSPKTSGRSPKTSGRSPKTSGRSPKISGRFKPISKIIIDQQTSVDKV